jgi:hypothetical protein
MLLGAARSYVFGVFIKKCEAGVSPVLLRRVTKVKAKKC